MRQPASFLDGSTNSMLLWWSLRSGLYILTLRACNLLDGITSLHTSVIAWVNTFCALYLHVRDKVRWRLRYWPKSTVWGGPSRDNIWNIVTNFIYQYFFSNEFTCLFNSMTWSSSFFFLFFQNWCESYLLIDIIASLIIYALWLIRMTSEIVVHVSSHLYLSSGFRELCPLWCIYGTVGWLLFAVVYWTVFLLLLRIGKNRR